MSIKSCFLASGPAAGKPRRPAICGRGGLSSTAGGKFAEQSHQPIATAQRRERGGAAGGGAAGRAGRRSARQHRERAGHHRRGHRGDRRRRAVSRGRAQRGGSLFSCLLYTSRKRKKRNGPCASKVAALAAEHEVMTGFAANAEVQGINGDERESRGVTRRK